MEYRIKTISLPNGSFFTVDRNRFIKPGLSVYEQLGDMNGMLACFKSIEEARAAGEAWS